MRFKRAAGKSMTPDFFEKSEASKLILGNYIAVVSLILIFPIKCR